MSREKLYEDIHNYTKFKLVEMLIEKHKDRFEHIDTIDDVSEDILNIISLCGLKFYGDIKNGSRQKK